MRVGLQICFGCLHTGKKQGSRRDRSLTRVNWPNCPPGHRLLASPGDRGQLPRGPSIPLEQLRLASELLETLRTVLYERIWTVRQASEHFQLSGLDGLEESLDGMVGALVRRGEEMQRSGFERIVKDSVGVVELGHKILGTIGRAKQLAGPLLKLLGAGDSS